MAWGEAARGLGGQRRSAMLARTREQRRRLRGTRQRDGKIACHECAHSRARRRGTRASSLAILTLRLAQRVWVRNRCGTRGPRAECHLWSHSARKLKLAPRTSRDARERECRRQVRSAAARRSARAEQREDDTMTPAGATDTSPAPSRPASCACMGRLAFIRAVIRARSG